ncbi:hypothetical protein SDC9_95739 [bioreactor metagenome]|uniref:Uncharacterized protein n=1 Tax=bioreactor metagenome TaxID=1076179 RepID=A0A645A9P1_9ZZZZ
MLALVHVHGKVEGDMFQIGKFQAWVQEDGKQIAPQFLSSKMVKKLTLANAERLLVNHTDAMVAQLLKELLDHCIHPDIQPLHLMQNVLEQVFQVPTPLEGVILRIDERPMDRPHPHGVEFIQIR